MKQPPMPRIKLPAAVRERVYRQAMALARSHADQMIAALERQLSAELAAAMQRGALQVANGNGQAMRFRLAVPERVDG